MGKPVILIIGSKDIFETISQAGFITADNTDIVPANRAIIIDLRNVNIERTGTLLEELRNIKTQKYLQIYGWTEKDADLSVYDRFNFDGLLNNCTPIAYIKARLESSSRIAAMAREASTRFATLAEFDAHPQPIHEESKTPIKILLLGDPCPDTLRITSILDDMSIESVAAFSSFSAFEYLHQGNFDAIIVFAGNNIQGSLGFCSALRHNSRLFHIPCLLLVGREFSDFDDAFSRGVTDIDYYGGNEENAIIRLLTNADEKRRRDALKSAFVVARNNSVIDRPSGLYNLEFFKKHLNALIDQAMFYHDVVSIIEVTTDLYGQKNPDLILTKEAQRRGINQIGSMLTRLVRTEDTAARVGFNKFAIILPFSDKITAYNAAQRICAVIDSSAFDVGLIEESAIAETKFTITEIDDSSKLQETLLKFAHQ